MVDEQHTAADEVLQALRAALIADLDSGFADLDSGFADVVRAHQRVVYTVALRLSRGHADAEDLAAEALLRAYRALRGYDAEKIRGLRLRPWLLTIVQHRPQRRPRRIPPTGSATRIRPGRTARGRAERRGAGRAGRRAARAGRGAGPAARAAAGSGGAAQRRGSAHQRGGQGAGLSRRHSEVPHLPRTATTTSVAGQTARAHGRKDDPMTDHPITDNDLDPVVAALGTWPRPRRPL